VADAVALVSGGEGCCPSFLYVDGQSSRHDRRFATERRLLCTHDEFSIPLARSLTLFSIHVSFLMFSASPTASCFHPADARA